MNKHITVSTLSMALAASWACPLAAQAADAPTDSAQEQVVEVAGIRDPDWRPYPIMLRGVDAFDKRHALAPAALLRFKLQAQQPGINIHDVKLRIAGTETSREIPVEKDGTFVLVRDAGLASQNAEILTNKKKDALRWRPHVVSPDLPPNARRLGDLRLECEVRWAIEKDKVPFMKRTLAAAMGGPCSSSMVRTHYYSDRPIERAVLVDGERRSVLPTGHAGLSYIPPLHDKVWPDDALIVLEHRDAP